MKHTFVSVAFLAISISAIGAEILTTTGEVYDFAGKTKLFDFFRYQSDDNGRITLRNEFKDLQGNVVVEEAAELVDDKLKTYRIKQNQIGQQGYLEVDGAKLKFKLETAGKVETAEESTPDDLIVGMTLVPHLRAHWSQLMKGDSIKTRFAVLDRMETIGFKFWKDSEYKEDNRNKVVIIMKPTSLIIRALVDPLQFIFDKDSKILLTLKGRTSPKIKKGDSWEPLDAFIKYSVKSQTP